MTSQFWNHIQPQLDEQIADVLGDTCTAQSLYETLKWNNWWEIYPFDRMKFHTDRNDLTFIQWMDAVDKLMGEEIADVCDELLKERIRCTIEHQWEMRIREIGEQEEHERRAAA